MATSSCLYIREHGVFILLFSSLIPKSLALPTELGLASAKEKRGDWLIATPKT